MVDRKSTLETAKTAHPVWVALQKPSTTRKKSPNDAEPECSIGPIKGWYNNVWWRYLLAGGIAGGVSRTLTAPLDRVKIYTQVHRHSMNLSSLLMFLVKQGGVLSLWRGNYVNVVKVMPESAIKFAVYEKIKRFLRGNDLRELKNSERFLAGAVAGGIAQSILFPLEVLKVRRSMNSGHVEGLRNIIRNMYIYEGLRSFYRGYVPNILGCVPYGGIEFTVYEGLKRQYTSYLPLGEQPGFFMLSMCSSIATFLGQFAVYPLSLVRTRLQSGIVENTTLIHIFRQIIRNDGPRGLYRGLLPNTYKVVPAVSLNFVVYEYVSRSLGISMT